MQTEEMNSRKNDSGNGTSRRNGASARHVLLATVAGLISGVPFGNPVSAHEGDYYPDETIPEKARSIIEDSTNGGSTTLIYVGIGGLVAAGAAVYLANMARNRRSAHVSAGDTDDLSVTTSAGGSEADGSGGDSSD